MSEYRFNGSVILDLSGNTTTLPYHLKITHHPQNAVMTWSAMIWLMEGNLGIIVDAFQRDFDYMYGVRDIRREMIAIAKEKY